MPRGTFDLGKLDRPDALKRTRDLYDVFGLIGRIENFRAKPGMRDRGNVLDNAYWALKSALLKPEEFDCQHIADPSTHLTDAFKASASRQGARLKPRLMLHARINQAGNLCVTVSTRYIGRDGRWRKAEEWLNSPSDLYFRGERPDDEVLYVQGVRDLVYWPGHHGRLPADEKERLSLATQAVVAAYERVVERLASRFEVQEDVHLTGIRSDGTVRAEWLGVEIVHGLDEHRASYASTLAEFCRETGLSPVAFWHMFGSGGSDVEAASVSRRLRSGAGGNYGMTPGVVRHWRERLDRAVRYGHWEVPAATDEQVAALAHLEQHRAALAASGPTGADTSGRVVPSARDNPGGLPDDVRAEFGIEDIAGLVAMLNEARAANGLRPMPQGDYPSNKANLARAVKALREFRERSDALPIP